MKLGIMQPYFFPYIGYFSLIKNTDKWIVFDEVQFIRHGWIDRNRILKPSEGWQYISVPLQKHSRETKIKDIKIRNDEDWKNRIFRQLEHYKKAPYYSQAIELISRALSIETDSIVELNSWALQTVCSYLFIPFDAEIFSKMNLEIEIVTHAGEWALNISKALRADEYINPLGGIDIFNPNQFKKSNIKLTFLKNNLIEYTQRRKQFESGLSVIDILMFNDVSQIISMVDDIELVNLV